MSSISIGDLRRKTGAVIEDVAATGRPAIITRRGKPVAVLVPLDIEALEDFLLVSAPEFVVSRIEADRDLRSGETRTLDGLLADLDNGR